MTLRFQMRLSCIPKLEIGKARIVREVTTPRPWPAPRRAANREACSAVEEGVRVRAVGLGLGLQLALEVGSAAVIRQMERTWSMISPWRPVVELLPQPRKAPTKPGASELGVTVEKV
jgi:hypothetical protein